MTGDMANGKKYSSSILLILLMGVSLCSLFAVTAGSPIFASDEYAYFIGGKFSDNLQSLHQLDPGLQRLSNLLFFSIIKYFSNVFGSHFVEGFRLIHLFEYLAAAVLIFNTVSPVTGRQSALLGVLAFLLLPTHVYIYAVMPEVELVLLASLLAFVLVRIYPRHGLLGSLLGGIVIGTAVLIKPHAIAMFAAALGAIVTFRLVYRDSQLVKLLFAHLSVLILAVYFTILMLWALTSGEWTLDPSDVLGLTFYGRYIDNPNNHISFLQKLGSVAFYLFAHVIVLFIIFAPVLYWVCTFLWKQLFSIDDPEKSTDQAKTSLAIFVLMMISSHLVMTAWFTAGAAALNDGESLRLHGRYLGPALAIFPAIYFFAVNELSEISKKILSVLMVLALIVGMLFVSKLFKIYPWDNPLFFAFFNSENWYQWNYNIQPKHLGYALYLFILVGVVISIFLKKYQKSVMYLNLYLILLAGCMQNYSWLHAHLNNNFEVSSKSKALGELLGEGQFGKGVVIAQERYGRASYLLFGLGKAVKTLDRPEGSTITEQDIGGADWVVFGNDYKSAFRNSGSIAFGSLSFYPLKSRLINDIVTQENSSTKGNIKLPLKPILSPGERIDFSLADDRTELRLDGFNAPENWGAWTAKPSATITLPVTLSGHIKLKIFGWAADENLSAPMNIRMSDTVASLPLTNAGADHEIDLRIKALSDHITIESSTFKPENSNRNLGVAIARMSIEIVKD